MIGIGNLRRIAPEGRRTVVFLHGSLSSGGMWRNYARALVGRYDVVSPDLIGHGGTPACPADEPYRLADETARIADAIVHVRGSVDIVAHSYGGLVALRFAHANPGRVRSLMLFEPTVFRVLGEPGIGSPAEKAEIDWVARTVAELVELGAPEAAMCQFVDYWNGQGAWRMLPRERQAQFVRQAATVARHFAAGGIDEMPMSALRDIDLPALVVAGARSTSAGRVTAWTVATQLPRSESLTVAGAGHMMPLTHPEDSLKLVSGWLEDQRVHLKVAA